MIIFYSNRNDGGEEVCIVEAGAGTLFLQLIYWAQVNSAADNVLRDPDLKILSPSDIHPVDIRLISGIHPWIADIRMEPGKRIS